MLKLISASGRLVVWAAVLFVAAILLLAAVHDLPGKIKQSYNEAKVMRNLSEKLKFESGGFKKYANDSARVVNIRMARLNNAGEADIRKAEALLKKEHSIKKRDILDENGLARAALFGNADAILASYRAKLIDLPLINHMLYFIKIRETNFQHVVDNANKKHKLNGMLVQLNHDISVYNKGVLRQKALKRDAESELRNPLCLRLGLPGVCSKVQAWQKQSDELAQNKALLDKTRLEYRKAKSKAKYTLLASEAVNDSKHIAENAVKKFNEYVESTVKDASMRVENTILALIDKYGIRAAWIVLGILLAPILHKMIAFGVIAPLAHRAQPIRLPAGTAPISSSEARTSIDIPLDTEHELFVRNGVQSASVNILGDSKAMLTWSMPFTCLAAGLVGLQRLRTVGSDSVSVTAVDDQHFEVALIEVPQGGSVVLQPRALVGIVKRRSDSFAVKRFWRLGQLISWVTFQFRYIVFYGPCTLVVQGNRGVSVEEAGNARMINKRLTIGFETGLTYSAARSTSFLPYLRGQQSLFNDSFQGNGKYIYEQRAAGKNKGTIWGRGLKGMGDAVLSAFGI